MGEKKTSRISEMVEMGGIFMVYYLGSFMIVVAVVIS